MYYFIGHVVIVDGNFAKAGETFVNIITRWDGSQWQRMVDEECARHCELPSGLGEDRFVCKDRNCELDGMVTALASNGCTGPLSTCQFECPPQNGPVLQVSFCFYFSLASSSFSLSCYLFQHAPKDYESDKS